MGGLHSVGDGAPELDLGDVPLPQNKLQPHLGLLQLLKRLSCEVELGFADSDGSGMGSL